MFRRICGGVAGLASSEQVAMQELLDSRLELLTDEGGIVDVKSDAGYTSCTNFLTKIDEASRAMSVEIASRTYRLKFSANYRALFPDNNRHYRVDVLEASVDQQEIWVNGEKFELSLEAIQRAQQLQNSWVSLILLLDRWQAAEVALAAGRPPSAATRPEKSELVSSLYAFDVAWASFENQYISELIAIEEQARELVVRAVHLEEELQACEMSAKPPSSDVERQFVLFIAQLNAVANFKRKGRDDLGSDILDSAREELRLPPSSANTRSREAARLLAGDVLASYNAMRIYFRKVGQIIEHVDPHLCNNVGLVARLVDWEETWEVGARYVKSRALLDAVCDIAEEIKAIQKLTPELTTMIEDCDVELFMVLPRLVVLCFLDKPLRERTELVRSLLPHRFGASVVAPSGHSSFMLDPDLKAVHESFKDIMVKLTTTLATTPATGSSWAARHTAWESIVRQAVIGDEVDEKSGQGAPSERTKAIADLLHQVERWSLELQRHCPEDWNQCSAVLVHCLTGGTQKEISSKFQV